VNIRPMSPDEEPRARELHTLCHPKSAEKSPRWYWTHPTLVAERDSRIIGAASLSVGLAPDSSIGTREVLWGWTATVDPAVRGQGVGKALVTAQIELARAEGLGGVIGQTQRENQAMRRTLEGLGFKLNGTLRGAHVYPGDVGGDEIVYTLDFAGRRA